MRARYDIADNVSVLRHVAPGSVISPLALSPRRLLIPYMPRPDFSLAYPLGPPKKFAMTHDPFLRYDIDALKDTQLNSAVLAEYVTTMGLIKPRGKTGLQKKSQKKIAKAIKRARVSRGISCLRLQPDSVSVSTLVGVGPVTDTFLPPSRTSA